MVYNFFKKIIRRKNIPEVSVAPDAVKEDFIGFVDELNTSYVCGWVCNQALPQDRLMCEAVLSSTGEVLISSIANKLHYETIKSIGDTSCRYAFFIKFPRILNSAEQKGIFIRVKNTEYTVPFAPNLKTDFQPFLHMAMDIVNNCNLRCPFCLYDYSSTKKTFFMDDDTINAALRFLPFLPDGDFWFSCLHEPTLHPQLIDYLAKVPEEYRKKIFFTTNLAKKLPDSFFEWVVNSGLHHLNVSLESLDPAIYERLRKGARQHFFLNNIDKLKKALKESANPISVRYIIMAYKSNLKELPSLFGKLIGDYNASLVEVRSSFDAPFIPKDFKETEFLSNNDWDWLEAQLKLLPDNDKVVILRELTTEEANDDETPEDVLSGRYMLRLSWDGHLKVFVYEYSSALKKRVEKNILETNVKEITDINVFYDQLIGISNNKT